MFLISLFLGCSADPEVPTSTPVPAAPTSVPVVESEALDEPEAPLFESTIEAVPEALRQRMQGVTMHAGCPVGFDGLRLLTVRHYDYEGGVGTGQIIVAAAEAEPVARVFERLFEARFAIEHMEPVVAYGGSDDASMAANNTSAFNCRAITGGTSYSQHSYGNAIDLNPRTNPYVRGELVLPPEGKAFVDRTAEVPGPVRAGGPATTAFASIGWKWGGAWTGATKDYQHFSRSGR